MEKTNYKPANISAWDVDELAAHILGIDEDDEDFDDKLEQALYDKFEIGPDQFHSIVAHLAPLCTKAKSSLTDEEYRGFAVEDEGMGRWIVKTNVNG